MCERRVHLAESESPARRSLSPDSDPLISARFHILVGSMFPFYHVASSSSIAAAAAARLLLSPLAALPRGDGAQLCQERANLIEWDMRHVEAFVLASLARKSKALALGCVIHLHMLHPTLQSHQVIKHIRGNERTKRMTSICGIRGRL